MAARSVDGFLLSASESTVCWIALKGVKAKTVEGSSALHLDGFNGNS
jgi:hypothetical protein